MFRPNCIIWRRKTFLWMQLRQWINLWKPLALHLHSSPYGWLRGGFPFFSRRNLGFCSCPVSQKLLIFEFERKKNELGGLVGVELSWVLFAAKIIRMITMLACAKLRPCWRYKSKHIPQFMSVNIELNRIFTILQRSRKKLWRHFASPLELFNPVWD